MLISCVTSAAELHDIEPDLVLFPEGIDPKEIATAEQLHPNAMVVGATIDDGKSRGFLRHLGRERIDYLKVESDGRTTGSGNRAQRPIYTFTDTCVGVLICMDVDSVGFANAVVDSIRSSRAPLKILCVPADMGAHWFGDGDYIPAPQVFRGVHLALCNHLKTYSQAARRRSFVTDIEGRRLVRQSDCEPIFARLPLAAPSAG